MVQAREMLKSAVFLKSDYLHLTSHCSMVELAASATHVSFESFLHGVRLAMRAGGPTFRQVCEAMPDHGCWGRIQAANYMSKLPQL
jgi:hypothetical protein